MQLLVLQRHVTDLTGGQGRTEVCYGVTSLDPARADPARLAALVQGHWQIEDRLHWVRDVTFDEDRSQVRTATAPRSWPACGTWRSAGSAARNGYRWAR